LLSDEKS